MKMNIKQLAVAAIFAALKLVLNTVFAGIAFGPLNFRVSNALLGSIPFTGYAGVLAFFISGIWTNMSSPLGPIDLVSPFIGAFFNILLVKAAQTGKNKLIFSAMVAYGVGVGIWVGYILNYAYGLPMLAMMANVAVSNTVVSAVLAYPVFKVLEKTIPAAFPAFAEELKA